MAKISDFGLDSQDVITSSLCPTKRLDDTAIKRIFLNPKRNIDSDFHQQEGRAFLDFKG